MNVIWGKLVYLSTKHTSVDATSHFSFRSLKCYTELLLFSGFFKTFSLKFSVFDKFSFRVLEKAEADEVNRKDRQSEDGDDSSDDLEKDQIEIEESRKEKWDCESILSTYSNLYNHPKIIDDGPRKKKPDKVQVSPLWRIWCKLWNLWIS